MRTRRRSYAHIMPARYAAAMLMRVLPLCLNMMLMFDAAAFSLIFRRR